jgi:hypothetical protein
MSQNIYVKRRALCANADLVYPGSDCSASVPAMPVLAKGDMCIPVKTHLQHHWKQGCWIFPLGQSGSLELRVNCLLAGRRESIAVDMENGLWPGVQAK